MFIHDFVHLPHSVATVQERLLTRMEEWLPLLCTAATDGQATLVERTRGVSSGRGCEGRVVVELFDVHVSGETLIIPGEWRPSRPGFLFPTLRADLEVSPLGARHTRLSVMGRYEVPLSSARSAVDSLLLHGMVESAIRAFLKQLAAAIDGNARVQGVG